MSTEPAGRESGRGRGGGQGQSHGRGSRHASQPRTVLVSKAMSRLLRHAAVEERIPIDKHGYVRMDHLLGWQRLRSMKPPVTFGEVVEAVRDNEKKRFALKYIGEGEEGGNDPGPIPVRTGTLSETQTARTEAGVTKSAATDQTIEIATEAQDQSQSQEPEQAKTDSETQRAISMFQSNQDADDLDPRHFLIRATQGHSMQTIEAESLLTPITLDDPATIPETVVHGTFYGAWDRIVQSGGLKRMKRNHVHFATGPALDDVLPSPPSNNGSGEESTGSHVGGGTSAVLLGKDKVISGMRGDAQILIYVDIRRALAERPDMKWWRSENGVILTEGVSEASPTTTQSLPASENGAGEGQGIPPDDGARQSDEMKKGSKPPEQEKLVPMEYWLAAVEVKEGLGLLWKHGEGTVRELPEHLRSRALPMGKRGHGPGRGRGWGRGQGRG
ncbi:hypothetical protein A1O1_08190 [Capronia coronata CBS 617.96]|uniref:2'-phosphotransferase n=1 Tax=Capronia coronata CBS 617.96 TaxID=1182541 RepID=W9XYR3_9EURO|nr:uncharacterized protein A1O1_08190 [Capronia coronata CBS 617.96]EXJ82121.1 hypothetical protein A1O1_08190 [Capronia coronata CBS 617.96]